MDWTLGQAAGRGQGTAQGGSGSAAEHLPSMSVNKQTDLLPEQPHNSVFRPKLTQSQAQTRHVWTRILRLTVLSARSQCGHNPNVRG